MTNITSVAQFFRESNGKKVVRTLVGGLAYEDWDQWVKNTTEALIAQGCLEENIVIEDNQLSIQGSNQYWMKPKIHREITGKMEVRSKDYIFEYDNPLNRSEMLRSFGNKKGLKVVENKLILELQNGAQLEYALVA